MSDLVVEELFHGEPVERLVGVAADGGVVGEGAHHQTDPAPAAPARRPGRGHRQLTGAGAGEQVRGQG